MTGFQIIGISFTSSMALLSAARAVRERTRMGSRLTWLLVWVGASVAIAWPGSTMRIASALGIGRGADLVFYVAVIAMMLGFFNTYQRLLRIESELTQLTRHLAIEETSRRGSPTTATVDHGASLERGHDVLERKPT